MWAIHAKFRSRRAASGTRAIEPSSASPRARSISTLAVTSTQSPTLVSGRRWRTHVVLLISALQRRFVTNVVRPRRMVVGISSRLPRTLVLIRWSFVARPVSKTFVCADYPPFMIGRFVERLDQCLTISCVSAHRSMRVSNRWSAGEIVYRWNEIMRHSLP